MRHHLANDVNSREISTAIAGGLAEWLFAILPLIVLTIVMAHLGKLSNVLESAEWSFGASILTGQSVVRFVAGALKARKLALPRVLLVISAVFVLIVVPSNTILALVLAGEFSHDPVSSLMATTQAGLFVIASLLFVLVAAFAHLWTRKAEA
jgi:hypothetical protein